MYQFPTKDIPSQLLQLLVDLLQLQLQVGLHGRLRGDRRLDRPDQHLLLAAGIPPPLVGMLPAAKRM